MTLTRHAQVRAQQRCIPPLIVDWLLAYGTRQSSHAAERVVFDKRARRALGRGVGPTVVKQMSRFMNTAIVVDPATDEVITVIRQGH